MENKEIDFKELAMRYIKNYEALKGCMGITENGKLEAMSEAISHLVTEDRTLRNNYMNMFVLGEMSREMFPEKIPGGDLLVKRKPHKFFRIQDEGKIIVITEKEYRKVDFLDNFLSSTCGMDFDKVLVEESIYNEVLADNPLISFIVPGLNEKTTDRIVSTKMGYINSLD